MKHYIFIFLLLTTSIYSQTPGNGVTDIDGNQYNSVIICSQELMKENLKVTKYTDGTPIPQVTDPTLWANLTTGAWCYYNNDPAQGAIYGKLYNWYAVAGIYDAASAANSALRKKLAPIGWDVPSDGQWSSLINCLDPNAAGGDNPNVSGGKMKAIGTIQDGNGIWQFPNTGANNISGFTGLPGGSRSDFGTFSRITTGSSYWSTSEYDTAYGWSISLGFGTSNAIRFAYDMKEGFSVRCIKSSSLNNQSFNNNSFDIYPNPAKDQITIDLGNNSNSIGGSYKMVNTLGQEVLNGVLNSQQNIIHLTNIKEQGLYFVIIYDRENSLIETKKIIIK